MPTNPYEPPKELEEKPPRRIEWFAVQQGILVIVSAWCAWLAGDMTYLSLLFRLNREIALLAAVAVGFTSFFLLWAVLWKLLAIVVGRNRDRFRKTTLYEK